MISDPAMAVLVAALSVVIRSGAIHAGRKLRVAARFVQLLLLIKTNTVKLVSYGKTI